MRWRLLAPPTFLFVASLTFSPACSQTTGGENTGSTSSSGGAVTCNPTGTNVIDPAEDAVVDSATSPDFSCYTTPVNLGPPETITLGGCVKIFGIGSRVKQGMKLAVYGINQDPGPGKDTPQYGQTDLVVGAPECDSDGKYSISGIPTMTPLIFKTFETATGASKTAVDTYHFNVVIRPDRDHKADGSWKYEANMVYVSTYTSIPGVAGKTVEGQNNVADGNGRAAIAGEIKDCSGNGRSVRNATIGGSCIDTPTAKIVYFDNQADPKPDTTRHATHGDGLFAILNVKASVKGPDGVTDASKGFRQELEGKVRASGTVVSAGRQQVWVYPDSVTIYSPQGLNPSTSPPASGSSSQGATSGAGTSTAGTSSVGTSSATSGAATGSSASGAGSSTAGGSSTSGNGGSSASI